MAQPQLDSHTPALGAGTFYTLLAATGFVLMTRWGLTTIEEPVANLALVTGGLGFGLALAPVNAALLASTDEIRMDPDGWTIRSADGSRGAHSEHTIAVTMDEPIVLTARS